MSDILSNTLIITKKQFSKGGLETVIQTYIEDEFLVHSCFLCLLSVVSFYPVIYFLNKQASFKMGRRMFDQMMIYAIMIITVCHFMAEQKSLMAYSFIPLRNWHKLVNIFLLIEQCSLVLYLGALHEDTENCLFGINLILILVLQEKDEVHGEIKYSMIPLCLNNLYLFATNYKSLQKQEQAPTQAHHPVSPSSS